MSVARSEILERMSQHQIELLRDLYAQIPHWVRTGEFTMDFLAPEIEFDFTQASFEQGIVQGLDAFRKTWFEFRDTFEEHSVEPREFIDAGPDHVIVVVRDGGRLKASESKIYNEFTHLWTFRDDVAIRWAAFTDKAQALKAAGISG
jgi:ketosteroid isomerase-like protein